jgi:hypothetical protein
VTWLAAAAAVALWVACCPVALWLLTRRGTRPPVSVFQGFTPLARIVREVYWEVPLRVFTGRYRPAPPRREKHPPPARRPCRCGAVHRDRPDCGDPLAGMPPTARQSRALAAARDGIHPITRPSGAGVFRLYGFTAPDRHGLYTLTASDGSTLLAVYTASGAVAGAAALPPGASHALIHAAAARLERQEYQPLLPELAELMGVVSAEAWLAGVDRLAVKIRAGAEHAIMVAEKAEPVAHVTADGIMIKRCPVHGEYLAELSECPECELGYPPPDGPPVAGIGPPGTVIRHVTAAALHSGRGSVLGGDTSRRARWWALTLDCGHLAQRAVRYRTLPPGEQQRGGTQHRSGDDVLPAPRRVRCDECAREAR